MSKKKPKQVIFKSEGKYKIWFGIKNLKNKDDYFITSVISIDKKKKVAILETYCITFLNETHGEPVDMNIYNHLDYFLKDFIVHHSYFRSSLRDSIERKNYEKEIN